MAKLDVKAVVLDLFDTLVKWEPERLPIVDWQGRQMHSTMPWVFPTLEERLGDLFERERFIEVYSAVVDEIGTEREHNGIEITCHERFFRAITRFIPTFDREAHALAEELTRVHMAGVRAVTSAPQERTEAVRRIAPHYRLGLLSNFDDAQCGRDVLLDTGVADQFEAVIISAEVGLRKPNGRIYRRMLEMLTLNASDVLFVGDTPREDILGPQQVGMRTAWISNGRPAVPEGIPPPHFTISDLSQLPHILGI
jgi:HAD superfamily hydrolase (TIGR01549 family)